jgi:hypothetical protein
MHLLLLLLLLVPVHFVSLVIAYLGSSLPAHLTSL